MTTYTIAHLKEGSKMFLRAYTSYRRYEGSPNKICEQIINQCWNGTYYQVSAGHFTSFYCRDFGMCAPSLIRLGKRQEVTQTLRWALAIFAKHNKITTTITKDQEPIDCFSFACDSLPFLLYALKSSGDKKLIEQYRPFLERQAIVYIHTVFDQHTWLVKENGEFSSIKDHYVRKSSCYDNCMVGWLLKTMQELKFDLPLQNFTSKQMRGQILKHFWTGKYFKDDIKTTNLVSSDAQFFPFYTGLFDVKKSNVDKKVWEHALKSIQEQKLDTPFPVKYTATRDKSKEIFFPSLLAPNYEGTSVWIHLGLCYIQTVAKCGNKPLAKDYLSKYTNVIERQQNFLEIFDETGKPYRSLFYQSDESMLWAAIYLDLLKV